MKRIVLILLTFLAFVCVMSSCSGELEYDSSGKISGTVIDMDSGEPIQDALITINPGNSNNSNVYSGYDGYFEFLGLDAKIYTVTVQKTGYATNRRHVTIKAGEYVTVNLIMEKSK